MVSGPFGTDAMRDAYQEPEVRIFVGSKPIPENAIRGAGECMCMTKMSLGIESSRDAVALQPMSYQNGFSTILGLNLEKYVAGNLTMMGLTTRQGEPCLIEMNHFGNSGSGSTAATGLGGAALDTVFLVVVHECELELKTGSAKLKE